MGVTWRQRESKQDHEGPARPRYEDKMKGIGRYVMKFGPKKMPNFNENK